MLPKNRRPVHPGEIIRDEYLEPLSMTQQQLADALGVTRVRINEIVLGKRSITPDTAFRLSKYFNTTPDFWLNLQSNVDMWDTLQLHQKDYDKIETLQ
jgi:addiction module HigA family antidote